MPSAHTEQQYFDIEKRLAESQEQILSATKDLQTLKEENKKLSEFTHTAAAQLTHTRLPSVSEGSVQQFPLLETSSIKLWLKLDQVPVLMHNNTYNKM